jgi:hypothetical protein
MGNNLPSFSTMSPAELGAWGWKYSRPTRDKAAEIFPGRPRGYVRIVQDLAAIATALASAAKCREANDHREAVNYDEVAEALRVELPDFARPS